MAEEKKPIIKPLRPLQVSDLIAGGLKAFYNQQKCFKCIGWTMLEMTAYKTGGRLIGDQTGVNFLTGSGKETRLIVEKEHGKAIEENIGVFAISMADNLFRKNKKSKEALKNAVVDTAFSYIAWYVTDINGDEDVLDYFKSLNPFDPENQPTNV